MAHDPANRATPPESAAKNSTDLFATIKALARLTDTVIIAYSGGKDAAVTLDLAARHFKTVKAYFMYVVPNLRCQDNYISLIEARYSNLEPVLRVPHLGLAQMLRHGAFRVHTELAEKLPNSPEFKHIKHYVRTKLGNHWILGGEKKTDSLTRRAWLSGYKNIDHNFRLGFPVSEWTDRHIWSYCAMQRLPLMPTYAFQTRSFDPTHTDSLAELMVNYPDDVEKIFEVFPLMRAVLAREHYAAQIAAAEAAQSNAQSGAQSNPSTDTPPALPASLPLDTPTTTIFSPATLIV